MGIKTYKSSKSAAAQSAHILRQHGSINGVTPKIIPIKEPSKKAFSNTEKMNSDERRRLRKNFQKCKDRAKKYRDNGNIPTAEKNEKRAEEIRVLLDSTEVLGKNHVQFIELEFCITELNPNDKNGKWLSVASQNFVRDFFGDDVQIISGAAHLDQKSLHAHIFIKPVNTNWTKICEKHGGYQEAYYHMTEAWNTKVKTVFEKISIDVAPIQKGTSDKYVELPKYKKMMKEIDAKKEELSSRESAVIEKEKQLEEKESTLNLKLSKADEYLQMFSKAMGELLDLTNIVDKLQKLKNSITSKKETLVEEIAAETKTMPPEQLKGLFNQHEELEELVKTATISH